MRSCNRGWLKSWAGLLIRGSSNIHAEMSLGKVLNPELSLMHLSERLNVKLKVLSVVWMRVNRWNLKSKAQTKNPNIQSFDCQIIFSHHFKNAYPWYVKTENLINLAMNILACVSHSWLHWFIANVSINFMSLNSSLVINIFRNLNIIKYFCFLPL